MARYDCVHMARSSSSVVFLCQTKVIIIIICGYGANRRLQETCAVSVMEDDTGGVLFSSSVNNVSHQFSISTVSLSEASSVDERSENKIDTVTAANDLLENGILVETNKGLVHCMIHDINYFCVLMHW